MRKVHVTNESIATVMENLLKRSPNNYGTYEDRVQAIVDDVKARKNEALFEYTKTFDQFEINEENIRVTDAEIEAAYGEVDAGLIDVIRKASANITAYHEKQKKTSWFDSQPNGIILGQKVTPMASVGIYVPGGKASYPSTVLMNTLPAKVAGVERIVMTTPANARGKVNPVTLVAVSYTHLRAHET